MTKQELIEKMAKAAYESYYAGVYVERNPWGSIATFQDHWRTVAEAALDVVQEIAVVYLPVEGMLPDAMALTRSMFLPGHDRAYIELNTQTDEGGE